MITQLFQIWSISNSTAETKKWAKLQNRCYQQFNLMHNAQKTYENLSFISQTC